MNKFKQLIWNKRDDGVIHSDPEGLRWAYYIYSIEDSDQFELVLIDEDGNSDEELTTIHDSIEKAQQAAQQHFADILRKHLL